MTVAFLRVVGGTSLSDGHPYPTIVDLRREAAQRLQRLGYGQHDARARATGMAIPASLRHLALQYEFVVSTLGALDTIPGDFRSDVYWPQPKGEAQL